MTKEKSMATCRVNGCEETTLVFSGIDAFTLGGIPTERYCYRCAGAYAFIKDELNPAND